MGEKGGTRRDPKEKEDEIAKIPQKPKEGGHWMLQRGPAGLELLRDPVVLHPPGETFSLTASL